ncbi:cytoskeletal protein RodZ [Paenibacillus phyllosphaerae]|uniref:Cytoskeletal protein RodZ n=1 Tax=Paenibacillus phyllosphaerae TaxID=274593 RepID=A0A7W5AWN3_9BACL|nr:RodZ family helix-turn-helix domain-containing protein [Paenibacillus phyllosphaerae]MBB3109461.1 cytoskeletal protein RodZ [Paenibacillus phyllosphaerae]
MSDLGALLKKAREQRGLSLDDVQDLTKIRTRYLEAIEEGNHSVLPGSFYVRAFVKNYAENVGLDADEVLRLYQHEMPAPAPEPVVETVQRPRRSQVHATDRWSRWGFRTLMWSFLILIVVIVYVFYISKPADNVDTADDQTKMTENAEPPKAEEPANQGTTNGQNATPAETVTPDPVVPETPTISAPVLEKTSGSTDYYTLGAAEKHTVEIKSVGDAGATTWLGVRAKDKSGKYLLNMNLDTGKSETLEIAGPFYITFAKAHLIEVTVDGTPIPDGDKTKTHKFQFNESENAAGNSAAGTGTTETQTDATGTSTP